jgi:hypothetical protein
MVNPSVIEIRRGSAHGGPVQSSSRPRRVRATAGENRTTHALPRALPHGKATSVADDPRTAVELAA